METFVKAVVFFLVIVGLAALFAYPTKWVANYLFSEGALLAVFGVSQLTFWKALALNFFMGGFKNVSTSRKS